MQIRKVQPKNKLNKIPLGEITASGWIKQQLEIEADGMGGHLDELEPDMLVEPFISRKHEEKIGEACGVGYSAEMSGTYYTGLVQLAFTLNNEELKKKAEKWVNAVLANQEEDGYIGAYKKTDNRKEDYNAWGTNWGMRALLAYFEATDRRDVLEACYKGLLWFINEWRDHKTDYVGSTLIESMLYVYLHTGDERLLKWSEEYIEWLEDNSTWTNRVKDFLGDRLPYGSAHVVAYGENVKHPALLYTCNGREDYLQASINGINKVLSKCTQRTGAPVSNQEYLGPVGSICETEYCNFATFSNTYSWMAAITGDARYGDLIEKIVFNGSQGAKKKDGKAIAYMSSPNQLFATQDSSIFGTSLWSQVYAPVFFTACCPTQSVRVMPEYVRGMCMTGQEGELYFVCYGPSNITAKASNGETVKIEEITEYPFKEEIKLKFSTTGSSHMKINLRMPGWCDGASIRINGKEAEGHKIKGTYFTIDRVWENGDVITIYFPMKVKFIEVNDFDFSNKRPIAVERGPLLFSMPVKTKWTEIDGRPITKLPEGWSWYNAEVDWEAHNIKPLVLAETIYFWQDYALDKKMLEKSEVIDVEYEDTKGGYPWIESPVKIKVPVRKVKYFYGYYSEDMRRTYEAAYASPVETHEEAETIELVPYGCTNLRVSYFPVSR